MLRTENLLIYIYIYYCYSMKCCSLKAMFVLQELVASTPNQRNWRGILIALLVIVAVLGLIVFSIVLLSPPEEGPRVKGRKFTLEDVLGPHYRTRRFNGTWVSGECKTLYT